MNKIFCDVCNNEIKAEIEGDMSLFKRIKTVTKIKSANLHSLNPLPMEPVQELVESTYDLCPVCGAAAENFLTNKKLDIKKAEKEKSNKENEKA
jgi:hypothetical protein